VSSPANNCHKLFGVHITSCPYQSYWLISAAVTLDEGTEVYQVVVRGEKLPTSCLLKTYFST